MHVISTHMMYWVSVSFDVSEHSFGYKGMGMLRCVRPHAILQEIMVILSASRPVVE